MILGIYGAGGTGKAMYDQISRGEKIKKSYEKIVFIDDVIGEKECYGLEVFSFNEAQSIFQKEEIKFIIALGDPIAREKVFCKVSEAGFQFATWIHPNADVSPSAVIGPGCYIDNCYIDNNVILEKNVIVFPQTIIGHDTQIKEHSVISLKAFIGGHSILEEKTYFGPCAACKDNIHIGKNAIIGLNAALYKDVPANHTAIGNPARNMARANEKVFS